MDFLRRDSWLALVSTAVLLAAACGKDPGAMNPASTAGATPVAEQGDAGAGAMVDGPPGSAGTRAPMSAAAGGGGASASGSAAAGGVQAGAAADASGAAAPEAGMGGTASSSPRSGTMATAGMSAAAGGGGTTATAPALGPDCDADPLASKRPFGSGFYQQFTGLFGCTAPADLALYRKLLPEKFEMPAEPQVCFYTIDFKISGVGPYHEAAILLPVTYKGQSGKYVLTMDLDNSLATTGGRAVGFPKYMGEVTIEQKGNDWVGTASANGEVDLKASYTGECNKSDEFLWPDFINLTPIPSGTTSSQAFLPPRTGSVLRVPAEYLTPAAFYSLKGSIELEINDKLPWNGLVDETKAFPGLLSSFVGGVDLGNQPLD